MSLFRDKTIAPTGPTSVYSILCVLQQRIWLVGWFLNVLVNNYVISRTGPKTECLTILRADTHETELGDHDFCLSRSHYTETDPTSRERRAQRGSNPGPPNQESRALPQTYCASTEEPSEPMMGSVSVGHMIILTPPQQVRSGSAWSAVEPVTSLRVPASSTD